jgi:gluconolactonase
LPAFGPPVPFPGHQSVLRLDPLADRSWSLQRLTFDTVHPGGLALSPDGSTLYVADEGEHGAELRAYRVLANTRLGPPAILHSFGPYRGIEGMCVTTEGMIIACAGVAASGPGALVYVFAPNGRPLATYALPEGTPTVCAFGEADASTLFVGTAEGHLYRVRGTGHRGQT